MKIFEKEKVENSSQVTLKCGRTRSRLQRPAVKSDSSSRPVIAQFETLRVDKKVADARVPG